MAVGGMLGGDIFSTLGVVFGDIATSPIYAIRECFHGQYGIDVSCANVLGILSLMFWALVLIVGLFLIQRRKGPLTKICRT